MSQGEAIAGAAAAAAAAGSGRAAAAAAGAGRTLNRDFKHVGRSSARRAGDVAPWLMFGAGLACGLAVALLVWLNSRDRAPAEPQAAVESTPASQRAADEAAADASGEVAPVPPPDPSASQPVDYEFYKLDDMTVEVSTEKPPSTAAPTQELLLQAGSFRSLEPAEKLQATLELHGIDSRVQRFTVDDENWYRVRIGPLRNANEQLEVQRKLADAEIEAFEVKSDAEIPPP
jgi:cell division septation protein DedD